MNIEVEYILDVKLEPEWESNVRLNYFNGGTYEQSSSEICDFSYDPTGFSYDQIRAIDDYIESHFDQLRKQYYKHHMEE